LDIAFREDDSRVRPGRAQHNMAVMRRRMTLNLRRHEKTGKTGTQPNTNEPVGAWIVYFSDGAGPTGCSRPGRLLPVHFMLN
jgi:hypothetical protein